MRLLRPDMAAWLAAIPFAIVCWFVYFRYTWRPRELVTLALSLGALALVAAALMRPQILVERRTPVFERRDLVLLLDRSVSMRARDVAPSRFGHAVQEVQRFLRQKPATIDRVGLIGFANAAVVLSYPTDDVDSLAFYLDWAQGDATPLFGTDIGGALLSALAVARRERPRVPPLFVLISDGDDQSGRLAEATAAVVRAGIQVHGIGIGSDASVPMPVPVSESREELLRDDYGEIMTTRFEGATLQRLAAVTGGQYFRLTRGGELVAALDSIALEDRRQVGSTTTIDHRDLYLPLLAAAAVATLALVALL